jgi:hypothetical protein
MASHSRSCAQCGGLVTTRRGLHVGADGAPCRWDELEGCWLESDGTPYDKKVA